MNETPTNVTTERARPKLVIFDDDSVLLQRFTNQYHALGYDVMPVLVAEGRNDTLFENGRIKQGTLHAAQEEPVYQKQVRTVATELDEARRAYHAKPNKRHAVSVAIYSAMQGFTYGVTSKTEARALLERVQPDFVLSDRQMRRPSDPDMSEEAQAADDDVIMGDHIMAMAAQLKSAPKRAIHTGQFTPDEDLLENRSEKELDVWRMRYSSMCVQENEKIQGQGFRFFPKDEAGKDLRLAEIDAYFGHPCAALVASKPARISADESHKR